MAEILDIAFDVFILWLLYKVIFEFIVPLFQSARQFRNKVQEAQRRMEGFQSSSQSSQTQRESSVPKSSPDEGEYIDFEEVR